MGVARKVMLEVARDGESGSRQANSGPGYGLQDIMDGSIFEIELDQETFFALLHMHGSGCVEEAKTINGINDVHDPTQIEGAQAQCMCLHGNDLPYPDAGLLVSYPYPAKIEWHPLLESSPGRRKVSRTQPNSGSAAIMRETKREMFRGGQAAAKR